MRTTIYLSLSLFFFVKRRTILAGETIYMIPTLDTTMNIESSNIQAQLAYILKIYLSAARSVNHTTSEDMISIGEAIEKFNDSPIQFKAEVIASLTRVIKNVYNSTMTPIIEVAIKEKDDRSFDISIDLSVKDNYGTIFHVDEQFTLDENNNVIINYKEQESI